jgi:hypothetical protein
MVAGQALAPTMAGLLLGLGAGALLVRAIAGPVRDPAWMRLGWRVSAAGAGLAVLGALAALTLADLRTLRTGVAELLRQVPPRRQRGRSAAREAGGRAPGARVHGAIGELLVLAVAAAAVYQARAQAGAGYEVPGLAALAPALVAVAVAVVAGRLLGYLATGIGSRALDAGRLRLALGALQISRRPGTERVFALVAVSVALLATAANGWAVSSAARSTRVVVDLGADRILTVRADSPTALLTAVRAADPAGREAMAVVVSSRGVIGTTILAVDSQRLARVARWRPEYPPLDRVLAALRGAAPAPALFAAGTLTLDATGAPVPPTYVVARLENQRTGAVDQVRFGPLSGSRQTYRADVAGCADPPGCRLVSLGLAGPPDRLGQPTQVVPGESAIVEGLAGAGTVAGADLLGDARRWRPAGAGVGLGLVIAPGDGRLRLTADGTTQHGPNPDFQAYLVDGPVPLPAVLAGDPPADWAIGQAYVSLLGADLVPVRVTATANVLPMVGQRGVLVDLAGARRLATGSGAGDVQQVWLAPGAGARVVERLRANRVQVVGDDSAAKYRARLDVQGPAAVARFAVVAASIGLLLAAGTVAVVGAVEREPRARELASLRAQGLRAPDVRAVGYVGYAATAGAAVLAGLLASLVARLLVDAAQPVFADSWSVLPTSTAPQVAALLATAAAAVAVVGFAAWLAGRQLVRAVTSAAGARLRRGQTGREAPWSR